MHVRALIGQAHPGKTEEIINIFHGSIVPAVKQQSGYKSGMILSDPKTGKILALSFWESEADMLASESNGYLREQLAKVAHLLAIPPVREAYEVSAQV